nr:MAG TPA: hypothetical protein [Caudoviricetes sp.]
MIIKIVYWFLFYNVCYIYWYSMYKEIFTLFCTRFVLVL